jgi:hypothetical protein
VARLHKSDNWRIEGKWTESIGLDGEHSFVQNEVRYTAVTFFIKYFILYSTTINNNNIAFCPKQVGVG